MKTLLCVILSVVGFIAAQAQSTFTVNLDGAQETPSVTTPATGSGTLVLNPDDSLTYNISYSGLLGNYTAAHIHGPAAFGEGPAGILSPTAGFTLNNIPTTSTSGTLAGTTAVLSGEQLGWLFDELLYVNIHSTEFGPGEIRGQIVPEPSTFALAFLALGALAAYRRRLR